MGCCCLLLLLLFVAIVVVSLVNLFKDRFIFKQEKSIDIFKINSYIPIMLISIKILIIFGHFENEWIEETCSHEMLHISLLFCLI